MRSWIGDAHHTVAPYSAGRYINYVEAGTSEAVYLGANTGRVAGLRGHYDPHATLITSLGR